MTGEISKDFNPTQVVQQLREQGFNAEVVPTPAKLNIGNALNSMSRTSQAGNKANIVSKEQYTYKDVKGTLIKYDDGSAVFLANKQVNGQKVTYQLRFKKESDIEKQRPSSEIINPGKKNQVTINYEYHRNGQVKNKETLNAKKQIIRQEEYNKKGQIQNRKLYDKDGNLQQDIRFKWNNKEHTSDVEVYDKDNKLISTAHNQYKDDGKTLVSQEVRYPSGALQSKSECYDNGKIHTSTGYYENGEVKAETEYWDNGVIKEQRQYDENGKVTKKISAEIDGDFGESRQVGEGDCYLMATINSIRNLDGGQQMLKDLVKVETNANGEKVYTVTFPGAQAAAEGLKTDSRIKDGTIAITGTYTFTESEMQEILKQAGKKYSLGDGDVILLEAAFEKYREEVTKTMEANGLDPKKCLIGQAGLQTGVDSDNVLSGGFAEDALFIMTGRKSQVYYDGNTPNGIDYEAMQQGELVVVPNPKANMLATKAVSEIDGDILRTNEDLNKMLDTIMNDPKDGKTDHVACAGLRTVHDDGTVGGHELTIKSVTEDTVTLINPWHPDKEITMSREDFISSVMSMNISDTTKLPLTAADVQTNPANPTPGGAIASHLPTGGTHNQQVQNNPNQSQLNQMAQQAQQHIQQNQQTQQGQQEQNIHSVRRGDNLWKIAKQHLGEGATATQIANYVNDIMEANPNLKWDRGHTFVMIRPGDNIILP